MPANFEYLASLPEYKMFAPAAIEAERVLGSSPALCAAGSRKALELCVQWVYAADTTISKPYKDNLSALVHNYDFKNTVDRQTWAKLPFIIKLGNLAVHTGKVISRSDAVLSLSGLFEFVQWIDYCYGQNYAQRSFDEKSIPDVKQMVDESVLREKDALVAKQTAELEALRAQVAAMSKKTTAAKEEHQQQRTFTPTSPSEFITRKKYIDVDLKLQGWVLGDTALEEYEVDDMQPGQKGYVDYVLRGADGVPLAVVEAKRTAHDPHKGQQQAKLYADALERRFKRRPVMFYTNGFETWFWDDTVAPPRQVSGVFGQQDLERIVKRRGFAKKLDTIEISDTITDRYYQKAAIRAVCEEIEAGQRKHLLVMATGTGKTRTASSLVDVLSRGGHVTNVLFLADRRELVRQAKVDFNKYLPDMSLCNLISRKDKEENKNARIVFSTYPTILNAIDEVKNDDGNPLYTPAHFDLIVIDEAHRSIFKKYRAIFDYFDAHLVGLTATPVNDVDRSTYDFFEKEVNVPTFAYDYDTAVEKDKVLVPYVNIEKSTKFLQEGIHYDELSEEDKARYEEDFAEDDEIPEAILPQDLDEYVFNQHTVDMVLDTLMTQGAKTAGGDRIGKTIIFAQNKRHARFIEDRFNALYPQYKGVYARRIVHGEDYNETLIADFKQAEKPPYIAISVDMLDTGIDVRELLNLVFFKRVRSKIKFWQMIGRGTRLCPELDCVDSIDGDYIGKRRFFIFDFLGNFTFFRERQNGIEGREAQTLTESIFNKKVRLVSALQEAAYGEEDYQEYRSQLVDDVAGQVQALNPEVVSVRMKLQYVERYKEKAVYACLSSEDRNNLARQLAPLVFMDDPDEYAKRFDNLMYGLMLTQLENLPGFGRGRRDLQSICRSLSGKSSIPQVKEQLLLITRIATDDFWQNADLFAFEQVRQNLRGLIKMLVEGSGRSPVYTALTDEIIDIGEGEGIGSGYDFADYRLKVNRYIEENQDSLAIEKLRKNMPLTEMDYKQLEQVFTGELGTKEDYERTFGETPFGLLVRRLAKMDRDAAMAAFSEFISSEQLSSTQIAFVDKIVDYIAANGYMDNTAQLMRPPFDKPQSFVRLFSADEQRKIIETVNRVKDNAVEVMEG